MKKLLTWLSRSRFPYTPLIRVTISKSHLLHNLREFQKLAPGGNVAPVLKSNAYGHGLTEIARILDAEKGIPFLIVDSYFEAVALHAAHIKTSLLIIGYTPPSTLLRSRLPKTSFTVTSLSMLQGILETHHRVSIHLKIDTGMHRQGIMIDEIPTAIMLIQKSPRIVLEGISTHLADADGTDPEFTHAQIQQWNELVHIFRKEFSPLKWIHASATYGHSFSQDIDANVSRLGIGLYGLIEEERKMNLQPVMEIRTLVTDIKTIKKGESIGYNATFTASHDMRVATIPAGYYEGIDRRLSNVGFILVGPQRIPCPIVGRVSMNITSIDVSHIPDIKVQDEAVIISNKVSDPNSINSIVKQTPGTIAYELVIAIPSHLKRVVG
jgi:alanine racemase